MSFDQTGEQASLAPWVTRPLPAKISTKVGREGFRSSFEQVFKLVSILEIERRFITKGLSLCRVGLSRDKCPGGQCLLAGTPSTSLCRRVVIWMGEFNH